MAVVDLLEQVQVHQRHRDARAESLRPRGLALQHLLGGAAVHQAGDRVGARQLLALAHEVNLCADVGDDGQMSYPVPQLHRLGSPAQEAAARPLHLELAAQRIRPAFGGAQPAQELVGIARLLRRLVHQLVAVAADQAGRGVLPAVLDNENVQWRTISVA